MKFNKYQRWEREAAQPLPGHLVLPPPCCGSVLSLSVFLLFMLKTTTQDFLKNQTACLPSHPWCLPTPITQADIVTRSGGSPRSPPPTCACVNTLFRSSRRSEHLGERSRWACESAPLHRCSPSLPQLHVLITASHVLGQRAPCLSAELHWLDRTAHLCIWRKQHAIFWFSPQDFWIEREQFPQAYCFSW